MVFYAMPHGHQTYLIGMHSFVLFYLLFSRRVSE